VRLLEVVVALAVGFLLLTAGWRVLGEAAVAGRALIDRSELLEVERLAPWLLERELAGSRPGEDWAPAPEGLSVRAYRGWGARCTDVASGEGAPGVVVGYRGLRQPDVAKDSVELTHADGRQSVAPLEGVATVDPADLEGWGGAGDRCTADTRPLQLRWPEDDRVVSTPGDAVVFVRVFERGLYAVDDALRYRRGAGGRQPLTAAVLDAGRSGLTAAGEEPALALAGRAGGALRHRALIGSAPR
jgi:hypothetical protein